MKMMISAVAALLLATAVPSNAQMAEPENVRDLALCQARTIVQVKAYRALSVLMRGSRTVALDDTTRILLDHTADSFSNYAQTLLDDAGTMDRLAKRITAGPSGYDAYTRVVGTAADNEVRAVMSSTIGPVPSSGPTEDLALTTAGCNDLVNTITSSLHQPQD